MLKVLKSLLIGSISAIALFCSIATLAAQIPVSPKPQRQTINGIDFAKGYEAEWVSQTTPTSSLKANIYSFYTPNDKPQFEVKFRNVGSLPWYKTGDAKVGFSIYKDLLAYKPSSPFFTGYDEEKSPFWGRSYFYDKETWPSLYRLGSMSEDVVNPGEIATFIVNFSIPEDAVNGEFREDFSLAVGDYWMMNKKNGDKSNVAHVWLNISIVGGNQNISLFCDYMLYERTKSEGNVVQGKKDGLWKWTFKQGLVVTANYSMDVFEGEASLKWTYPEKYRYPGKTCVVSLQYVRGKLDGPTTETFEGSITMQGQYKNGKQDGIWKGYYYPSGHLHYVTEFLQGNIKEETRYADNGVVIERTIGTHKMTWDTNGNLIYDSNSQK